MALHLVKLCVGVNSVEELQAYRDFEAEKYGGPRNSVHTTRMVPTRIEELLDGGSLYWVIKGVIQVRQRLADIRPFKDDAGVRRCDLVLDPRLIQTKGQPRRPFQGWRYLKIEDAPADLRKSNSGAEIPEGMRRDLAELCLI